ncbi:MAG: hypothetical protein ACLSHC_05435 [Bilophila wadsworthia]
MTIRVTEEKTRLMEQAEIAGLSCRNTCGGVFRGRPLVAHADLSTVAELRRIGGLLKHNFETLRQAKAPRIFWNGRRTPYGIWSGPSRKSRWVSS